MRLKYLFTLSTSDNFQLTHSNKTDVIIEVKKMDPARNLKQFHQFFINLGLIRLNLHDTVLSLITKKSLTK